MIFSFPYRSMNGSYGIYRIKEVVVTLILIGKLYYQFYVGFFGKKKTLVFSNNHSCFQALVDTSYTWVRSYAETNMKLAHPLVPHDLN